MSSLFYLCVLCGLGQAACGRKGPPLAPIVYVPRPVTELVAKRVEGDIVLHFKVPTANTDNSSPADLDRLEVYAHTGPLPATADFLKYGTLVQRIEVKQPPEPSEEPETGATGTMGAAGLPAETQSAKAGIVEQGWATSVRETLTEKHMELGPLPPTRAAPPARGEPDATTIQVETLETPGTVNFPMPVSRYYTIVGVSTSRNRRGPYAGPIRVPLISPLQSPEKVDTTYAADAIALSWAGQPEDGVRPVQPAAGAAPVADSPAVEGPDQETPETYEIYADVETPETADAPRAGGPLPSKPQPLPTPRFGYNVYDTSTPGAPNAPVAPSSPSAPVLPLNAAMLTTPAFTDPRVEFGTERCYIVRRVEMVDAIAVESAASPPACVTPIDKFAPVAPKELVLVATGTAVSLIWEANTEADLAGYVVLRGEAPGDKLAPLTQAPISDAAYVDTSIRRTRTYVYEVIAVDKTGNQSAPSNRVEESIR